MKFHRAIYFFLPLMILTACQMQTPQLAEQPIHTVNPIPAPILTKHHTDDELDLQHLAGRWIFQHAQLSTTQDDTDLLHRLDQQTFILLSTVSTDGHIGITASIGCNQMSITRHINTHGKLSNIPNQKNIILSTLMGCGDIGNRTENRLMKFLWASEQIQLHGSVLSLTDYQGNVLTFQRQ